MKSIYLLLAVAAFSGSKAFANETTCLSNVMYAEAKGASLEGTMIVGECMLTRAGHQGRSICNTTGVKRHTPPVSLVEYYKALARQLLSHPSRNLSKGCDSWNAGKKPAHVGKVTRHADGQVFYVMQAKRERVKWTNADTDDE